MDRPAQVEDFALGALVGEGLTGQVWQATTPARNGQLRRVALKLCHPTRSRLEPWAWELLGRELDPRLVRYEALGGRGPAWAGYYATDLLRPWDPALLLGEVGLAERVQALGELAEALAGLHARGRVHGALRAGCVLFRRERGLLPLVIDLGVRPVYDPAFHDAPEQARRLYPYLAPEALSAFRTGAPPPEDPAQDVWALGALLALLAGGAPPGAAAGERTLEELLAARRRPWFVHALPAPGERVDLGILNRLLSQALAARAAERPSALFFADAVLASLGGTRRAAREERPVVGSGRGA